ncbi:MAG: DUF494 domain-containing protein [Candidatus Eisenbacteria bacterium]|uniref:DUF494 domain-containing protein n=1 Tax=Eiseniibacteriota bacterium TaxID=2212470 RepID=A0A538U883_UNCEI|nr:MAG: DUF494 domain-containing protein [Candidatus Eisenbacteria bacterium]
MTASAGSDPVLRLLDVIAERLEAWLAGDELALESLGEALQGNGLTEEHLQAAILTLKTIAGTLPRVGTAALEEVPGRGVHRMLSPLERESLSPEAWGYLLALRRRGSLDAGQFERVLDRLTATGVRPIEVELVREVAARVALRPAGRDGTLEYGAGDGEVAH